MKETHRYCPSISLAFFSVDIFFIAKGMHEVGKHLNNFSPDAKPTRFAHIAARYVADRDQRPVRLVKCPVIFSSCNQPSIFIKFQLPVTLSLSVRSRNPRRKLICLCAVWQDLLPQLSIDRTVSVNDHSSMSISSLSSFSCSKRFFFISFLRSR